MRILGLAKAIASAGVPVVETAGWESRGNPTLIPRGIVHHHDVSSPSGESSMLNLIIKGRTGLAGPLYNVWFNREGVAYIIASGKANHAGKGGWLGLAGNSSVLGFCLSNRGTGEEYPEVQIRNWAKATVAVNRMMGIPTTFSCGHKEWAPTRKIDPFGQSMEKFRRTVEVGFDHDALTPREIENLRGMLASMYRVNSNPSYPQYLIQDYRRRNQ